MKETELGGKKRQRMTKIGTVKKERERLGVRHKEMGMK